MHKNKSNVVARQMKRWSDYLQPEQARRQLHQAHMFDSPNHWGENIVHSQESVTVQREEAVIQLQSMVISMLQGWEQGDRLLGWILKN